jgi:hypothetical protein
MEKFQSNELELLEKKLNNEPIPKFYILDSVFNLTFSDPSAGKRLGIFFGEKKMYPKWQIELSDSLLFIKNKYRVRALFTITKELIHKLALPSSGLHYEIFDQEVEIVLNDYILTLESSFEDDGTFELRYEWDYEKIINTFFPSFIKNSARRCSIVNFGLYPLPRKIENEDSQNIEFLEFYEDEADRFYPPFSYVQDKQVVRGCYAKIIEYDERYPRYIELDDIGKLLMIRSIPKKYLKLSENWKAVSDSSFNDQSFSFKLRLLETFMPKGEVKKLVADILVISSRFLREDQPYVLRLYGDDDTTRFAKFSTKKKALRELRRLRQIQPLSFSDITSENGYFSSE